ncbi:class I glutamine amidotransferase-like protein [Cladochytrium replicatum]|nr:class I glutamine amidotransferase-like protein [Cladochytrium replicatum]
MSLKIAAVLFPMWELLDLMGPLCVLIKAAEHSTDPVASDTTFSFVGLTTETNESASHLPTIPSYDFATAPQFDVLIVPGGIGTRSAAFDPVILDFLRRQAPLAKYIVSVCTGSCVLANAGILDGRRATSNKMHFGVMSMFAREKVTYVHKARFVEDGKVWTGSGVSAGVDLGFALAAKLFGADAAKAVESEWGYEPLADGDDPFASIHPVPDLKASEEAYRKIFEMGPMLVAQALERLEIREGKRRVVTVLAPGFDAADVGFVGEALLAVRDSHWYDLVHLGEGAPAVNGGLGYKHADFIRAQTDRGWSKESQVPLVDELTDIVFVPSVPKSSSDIRGFLEELANTPSHVCVILCGDVLVEQFSAILGITVKFDESGCFKHGKWFFAQTAFGAVRATLEVMVQLVGLELVKASVINMELSPKLLPAVLEL